MSIRISERLKNVKVILEWDILVRLGYLQNDSLRRKKTTENL